MAKRLNQKEAGDLAARAVDLYNRGRTHKDAISQVEKEAKRLIKAKAKAKK